MSAREPRISAERTRRLKMRSTTAVWQCYKCEKLVEADPVTVQNTKTHEAIVLHRTCLGKLIAIMKHSRSGRGRA